MRRLRNFSRRKVQWFPQTNRAMSLSSPILTSDTEGVAFAKLQRLIRLALDNASISYSMSGLLTPISPSDTRGVKFAKLGAWLSELATNISGGGGGTGNVRSGTVALAQNDTEKAVVFSTAFTGASVPQVVPIVVPPVGGDAIEAWVEDGDATNAGATVTLAAAIPTSGYQLTFVANKE